MQKFLFIAAVIFTGLYFAFKNKDATDFQKAIGNPAVEGQKTKSEKMAEKEKLNKYEVGDCIKVSRTSDWEAYKITKVDTSRGDYHYKLCVKFKGCQKEILKEIITNLEYDYPPATRKTKCPK